MTIGTFQKLHKEFELAVKTGDVEGNQHSAEALRWFYDYIRKNIQTMNALEGLTSGKRDNRVSPGSFYTYTYNPKYKDTLPYYDTVPLILCTSVTPKGWYGINFHYIPPRIRMMIVKRMYSISRMTSNDNVKFKLSWKEAYQMGVNLGQSKWFKHAIKQYLANHVTSNMIKIKGENIEPMIFLPIARFKKKTQKEVWKAA